MKEMKSLDYLQSDIYEGKQEPEVVLKAARVLLEIAKSQQATIDKQEEELRLLRSHAECQQCDDGSDVRPFYHYRGEAYDKELVFWCEYCRQSEIDDLGLDASLQGKEEGL